MPTAPLASYWNAIYGQGGDMGGGAPALNALTRDQLWNVMQQYGEGGSKSGTSGGGGGGNRFEGITSDFTGTDSRGS